MPDQPQILTLWGAPGAGKTTTAVKIAKELASRNQNVLLVLCDNVIPGIPCLIPKTTERCSLGSLLALPKITQTAVLRNCVTYDKRGFICLLGYVREENEISYTECTIPQAKSFLRVLRGCADYIIIDGSRHFYTNPLTAAALENADCVLKLVNADIKSALYVTSQELLLRDEKFRYSEQINVMNNVWPEQNTTPYEHSYTGGVRYTLPHLEALRQQFDSASLLDSLMGRDAKQYEPVIRELVNEVFFPDE